MALGRTFAGLMQASQPYWNFIIVSLNQYSYRLSEEQQNTLRIIGYVGGRDHMDVSGSYGTAFERDDGRVVKVTTDPADLAAHVLLRKMPHVLDIYDVFKLQPAYPVVDTMKGEKTPTTLYAMVVEHVDDLPPRVKRVPPNDLQFDKMDVRRIIEVAGDTFGVEANPRKRAGFGTSQFEFPQKVRDEVLAACSRDWSQTLNQPLPMKLLGAAAKLDRVSTEYCRSVVNQLFALSTAAARLNIRLDDFHSGNFGIARSTGQWALRDLGSSETYPDVAVRAVAGLAGLRTIR